MQHKKLAAIAITGLVLAGCTSGSSSTTTTSSATGGSSVTNSAAGTAQWIAKNKSTVSDLGSDITSLAGALPSAISSGSVSSLTAGCQKLATDVATAKALPPIPNATAQQRWTELLTKLDSASKKCTNGVSKDNTNKLSKAQTEISDSNGILSSLNTSLGL
jgi:outer membrane lipoprotein SlyB